MSSDEPSQSTRPVEAQGDTAAAPAGIVAARTTAPLEGNARPSPHAGDVGARAGLDPRSGAATALLGSESISAPASDFEPTRTAEAPARQSKPRTRARWLIFAATSAGLLTLLTVAAIVLI